MIKKITHNACNVKNKIISISHSNNISPLSIIHMCRTQQTKIHPNHSQKKNKIQRHKRRLRYRILLLGCDRHCKAHKLNAATDYLVGGFPSEKYLSNEIIV